MELSPFKIDYGGKLYDVMEMKQSYEKPSQFSRIIFIDKETYIKTEMFNVPHQDVIYKRRNLK